LDLLLTFTSSLTLILPIFPNAIGVAPLVVSITHAFLGSASRAVDKSPAARLVQDAIRVRYGNRYKSRICTICPTVLQPVIRFLAQDDLGMCMHVAGMLALQALPRRPVYIDLDFDS
jgi:hypothetical protein